MLRKLHFFCRLYKDPRTPAIVKSLPLLALLYVLLPVDIIPDFILGAGQLDDILAVVALVSFALKLVPKSLYEDHKAAERRDAEGR